MHRMKWNRWSPWRWSFHVCRRNMCRVCRRPRFRVYRRPLDLYLVHLLYISWPDLILSGLIYLIFLVHLIYLLCHLYLLNLAYLLYPTYCHISDQSHCIISHLPFLAWLSHLSDCTYDEDKNLSLSLFSSVHAKVPLILHIREDR